MLSKPCILFQAYMPSKHMNMYEQIITHDKTNNNIYCTSRYDNIVACISYDIV